MCLASKSASQLITHVRFAIIINTSMFAQLSQDVCWYMPYTEGKGRVKTPVKYIKWYFDVKVIDFKRT